MEDLELATLGEPPTTDSGYVEQYATKAEASALKAILDEYPDAWVSFRRDFDLNLKGDYSNHVTPEAIYGLDTSVLSTWADSYMEAGRDLKFNSFHNVGYNRRPRGVVFEVDGRVVSSETYTDFDADWAKLKAYVANKYPLALPVVERWIPKREHCSQMQFKAIIWATEHVTDFIVKAEFLSDVFKHHPDKPAKWREMLTAIGIDALEDRAWFLTGDCGPQIAVINPKAIRVLATFDNPASAKKNELDLAPEITGGTSHRM